MKNDNKLCTATDFMICYICGADLAQKGDYLHCGECKAEYPYRNGIAQMLPRLSEDLSFSMTKWDKYYEGLLCDYKYMEDNKCWMEAFHEDLYRQLDEVKPLKDLVYLEVGCGPFYFGQSIARDCELVIGIDVSYNALKLARQMLEERGIENFLLIQADILQMPIRSQSIDLIYGGGVIEHFKDTQGALSEMKRVLKDGGVCFNTVPLFNLGSLYRQIWGNIPDFPVLKQLAEFVHIKLLKGKHMIFGYELSFRESKLRRIHKNAGFADVEVARFEVQLKLEYIPKILRGFFSWLGRNSKLFWPMVKVIGFRVIPLQCQANESL